MDEDAPRYWLWILVGLSVGTGLAVLTVITALPHCGINPVVRVAEDDVKAMPGVPGLKPGMLAKVQRGYYLTKVAGCAYCHTPLDPLAGPIVSEAFSGGVAFRSRHFGTLYSANLTPDLRSGLGLAKSDHRRLRSALGGGISVWGRSMHPAAMPWHLIGQIPTEDQQTIMLYLINTTAFSRALPPRGAPTKGDPEGVWMGLGAWSKRYE